jgi:transcriptional regulator with XRE-family HTH domain
MNHGNQLRLKLRELGVKKKKLAELMGVHANTITQWLNKEVIGASTRCRIASALGISEDDAFTDKTYVLAESELLVLKEPMGVYDKSASQGSLKKLDALQYCGLLNSGEDGLELQRKWRAEW